MKRRHLFEFEDLPWFSQTLRDYITDFLCTVAEKFNMFGPVVSIMNELLSRNEKLIVVDLASGGGGQWRRLIPQMLLQNDEFKLVLTDKYPNVLALNRVKQEFPNIVSVMAEPVDASRVPKTISGMRTLFLSLHHFEPEFVVKIFKDAVESNEPIAAFEAQQRNVEHVIRFCFSPIMCWVLTPLIRPFSLWRLIFTYIVPIIPVVILWDGVVSVLRTYTLEEAADMARIADAESKFIWHTELVNHGKQKIQVITGYPKEADNFAGVDLFDKLK